MKKEDRETEMAYATNAWSCIHMIRRAMRSFTPEDIYQELIAIFLELIEKYKPIVYTRNEKKYRISFAHYAQVSVRYALCRIIVKNSKDIITGRECLEFRDDIHNSLARTPIDILDNCIGVNLKDWVWGRISTFPFESLSEMERYLLWLRHESDPDGKRLSTREMADVTGYHERTIIYKLKSIKKKLKESMNGGVYDVSSLR
jgi:hypothetical protein